MQNNHHKKRKKILITGCSSGFGLYCAVKAVRQGHEVIATLRNMEKARYIKEELGDGPKENLTIAHLDVTDREQIKCFAAELGPVDVLVNNAGILVTGSFLTLSDDEVERIFETNYFGAVNLTRAFADGMIEQKEGLIINVASLAGLVGHMFNSAYSASKHALIGFTRSIRLELKPFNVKVVSVEPGYHKTEIIRTNANISENFYDRKSPMFEYNRAFLRLMREEITPRAGEVDTVVNKLIEIINADSPKDHYVIGKDAFFATTAKWLGLDGLVREKVYKKLMTAARRENRRDQRRKEARKNKRKKSG
jgi:NAD(P)-dependent dehydrogenase (short-subunit alcohol dehydrogenase family)